MNSKLDIKLNIPKGLVISPLKEKILMEELHHINETIPLEENQINLAATYFLHKNNEVEVGFFIRNTFKSSISLANVELAIKNSIGNTISTLHCNLEELGAMPSYTGTHCNLKFILNEGTFYNSDEKYRIIFNNIKEVKGFKSVKTDIENMPIDISFEEEEEIRKFERNLSILKKNEVNIEIFKIEKGYNNSIDITLLMRNGYDKDIKLERLPITIMNYNNYPICKHVFHDSNGLVNISSQRAKLLKLSIDKSKLYNTVFDLKQCKILFQ
ncbi:MAG TPA: hypothetical protein DCW51_15885 [Clostridium sp.]|nr:hypothetical protein [Clostridium sp.]